MCIYFIRLGKGCYRGQDSLFLNHIYDNSRKEASTNSNAFLEFTITVTCIVGFPMTLFVYRCIKVSTTASLRLFDVIDRPHASPPPTALPSAPTTLPCALHNECAPRPPTRRLHPPNSPISTLIIHHLPEPNPINPPAPPRPPPQIRQRQRIRPHQLRRPAHPTRHSAVREALQRPTRRRRPGPGRGASARPRCDRQGLRGLRRGGWRSNGAVGRRVGLRDAYVTTIPPFPFYRLRSMHGSIHHHQQEGRGN